MHISSDFPLLATLIKLHRSLFVTSPQFTQGVGQHTNKQTAGAAADDWPARAQHLQAAEPGGWSTHPRICWPKQKLWTVGIPRRCRAAPRCHGVHRPALPRPPCGTLLQLAGPTGEWPLASPTGGAASAGLLSCAGAQSSGGCGGQSNSACRCHRGADRCDLQR